MVLIRFLLFRFVVSLFLCFAEVNILYAQDFSTLNQTQYLHKLSDDSLKYAWELYKQSVDWQEKCYPSLYLKLSEKAEEIFYRKLNGGNFAWQDLETTLRYLDISFSRNRMLLDKDEESSLRLLNTLNLLKVNMNFVRIKTILEKNLEQPDSLLSFYNDWFRKCKVHYWMDYSLYKIKRGELHDALNACREALTFARQNDTVFFANITCQERAIQYLMKPFHNDAKKTMEGLKQIVSPSFTKYEILNKGSLPLFYLCGVQLAQKYENQRYIVQSIQAYRLLLAEIRKHLASELPFLLPEERGEIVFLLQYYLDIVQSFSLRHINDGLVGELLLDHSLLKEEFLSIAPSPVFQSKEDSHPFILDLQESIDSLYFSPDYYLLSKNPEYLRKVQLLDELMMLKRKQVSFIREHSLVDSVSLQIVDWRSLKELLKPNEAIIKIIDLPIDFFDRQYVALVITSDSSSPGMAILPRKREFFRIFFENMEEKRIWEPICRFLKQQTELYLCLDGELVDFNWNDVYHNNKRLVYSYDLHYLLSTKDFFRLKHGTACDSRAINDLYGFGGAYFYAPPSSMNVRGPGLQYLPGSKEELCRIDTMIPEGWKSHLFLGVDANKYNFLGLSFNIVPHSVIHIATHGFSLTYDDNVPDGRIVSFEENHLVGSSAYEDPMLRNGFLLTGANKYWNKPIPYDATDSGIVTAHDVSQMNLCGTDLVVISACQSASGESKDGEGMFGLVRAFKMAGVKSILANLNNISDAETVSFITTFYRNWISVNSVFDAFVKTQRELIDRNPENAHLWSSFVLFE